MDEERKQDSKTLVFAGMLAGINGQGAQFGIEDFSNKMPSGGGCVLFEQLPNQTGSEQLFLKWETVGMPSVFSTGTHADDADGMAQKVRNRYDAQHRCMDHAMNFLKGHSADDVNLPGRREGVKKGLPKQLFQDFNAFQAKFHKQDKLSHVDVRTGFFPSIVQKLEEGGAKSEAKKLAKTDKKVAKKHGLYRMEQELAVTMSKLIYGNNDLPNEQRTQLMTECRALIERIHDFNDSLGTDLGIDRKGAEIHANLV